MVSGSGSQAKEARTAGERVRRIPRRTHAPRGASLPQYDVRLIRELAHRRFVVSLLRRTLRLASLHLLDAVAVAGAVWVAALLTDLSGIVPDSLPPLIAFVLVGLNLRGSYRPGDARRDAHRLVSGVAIALALALLPGTVTAIGRATPHFVVVFAITAVAALILERRMVNAIVHAAYARGIGLRRAVVIARQDEFKGVLSDITPHQVGRPAEDQVIVGYVTPELAHDQTALGSVADLESILERHDVSELIVATVIRSETLTDAAEICFERGVCVLVLPAASTARTLWTEPTRVGRVPAYQLHPTRLELPALILKRASDLLFASFALVVSAPLMLLIAFCIKAESRGPVFFRQRRVGLGGRPFMMWKFRSMLHEAETRRGEIAHLNAYGDGRLFKLRSDPRITRVGRWLRRFSLDELPQLFNVLVGDMSLVGPRPPLPAEVRSYEPRHFVRLSVVPGLTGPWQVSGRNLITDFEEVVRLEREYIEKWSLRTDIEIMLRTVGVVLSGRGAY